LIINDRVVLAIRTGAHGVHIGQGDGCPVKVRRRIGAQMILGLSVETEAQARGAAGRGLYRRGASARNIGQT